MPAYSGRVAALCRRRSVWAEVGLVVVFYLAYAATRALAPGTRVEAVSNARHLLAFERAIHIDPEWALNHALWRVNWLSTVAGYYYLTLHFAVTVGVLAAVYFRRPQLYPLARTSLVVASFSALFAFWFIPVAPPRLAEGGIVDAVVQHNVFGSADAQRGGSPLENIYAAMPSLHVGWALWVALVAVRTLPRPWSQVCAIYPVATAWVVLSTGNHYLLDAVAGAVTVLVADAVCRAVLPRSHRARGWSASTAAPSIQECSWGAGRKVRASTTCCATPGRGGGRRWWSGATPEPGSRLC
jgi:hypothetical protein